MRLYSFVLSSCFILITACQGLSCANKARIPATTGDVRVENANSTNPDYVPTVTRALPTTDGSKTLTVISWNVKHLGRQLFDPRQAAPILADADIVALQEVNTKENGVKALKGIAEQLQTLMGERICMGLTDVPTEEDRERYAYLWKNSRVAYVKTNGEIMEDCPPTAITIRLGVSNAKSIQREPAFGTFYFKPTAKQFLLSSIHLVPTEKQPQNEVAPLFQTFSAVALTHPIIVAGDYNLDSSHPSFLVAREMGFHAAMVGVKTSLKRNQRQLHMPYDNFWYLSIRLVGTPSVINLYDVFTEKSQREIYKNLSDHCPIRGQFEFNN